MGLFKRIRTRIRVWRFIVSLIAGVVLTIAVAWWFECQPLNLVPVPYSWEKFRDSTGYRPLPQAQDDRLRYWALDRGAGSSWLQVINSPRAQIDAELLAKIESAPAAPLPRWASVHDRVESNQIIFENLAGWPFRCLRSIGRLPIGRASFQSPPVEDTFSMPLWACDLLDPEFPEVPIGIMPLRFAGNTMFYMVFVYAFFTVPPIARTLRRRLTNRCPACGYSLDKLTAPTCPECGEPVRPASP